MSRSFWIDTPDKGKGMVPTKKRFQWQGSHPECGIQMKSNNCWVKSTRWLPDPSENWLKMNAPSEVQRGELCQNSKIHSRRYPKVPGIWVDCKKPKWGINVGFGHKAVASKLDNDCNSIVNCNVLEWKVILKVSDVGKDRWKIVRNLSEFFLETRPTGGDM